MQGRGEEKTEVHNKKKKTTARSVVSFLIVFHEVVLKTASKFIYRGCKKRAKESKPTFNKNNSLELCTLT